MGDLSDIFHKITSWSIMQSQYPLVDMKSTIDNKIYRVRDLPDKQEAANLLAKVRIKMSNLMTHLETKYQDKPQIQRLVRNFRANPERLLESTPDADHTSYSVNKGEKVHLCLRQREGGNEQLVNDNVMMFVALHEMAHMITATIGHGPDFWNNFGFLLKEAEQQGIYKHQDFKSHPVAYCGVSITDAPSYDPSKDTETTPQAGNNLQIGTLRF
jgi:hypothetical protein